MNNIVLLVSYTLIASLLGTACGSSESKSSTASIFSDIFDKKSECAIKPALESGKEARDWRTVVRDEPIAEEIGGPGNYGVEISEEIKKGNWFEAGDSGILRRRTCSQAYILRDGKKTYLEKQRSPGSLQIAGVRTEQGYLLMSGMVGEKAATKSVIVHLNLANSERQIIASEATPLGGCYAYLSTKVSPAGQYFLIERLQAESCGFEEPRYNVTITIFNAKALILGIPVTQNMTGGSQSRWLTETSYQLQDNERSIDFTVPDATL